MSSKNFKSKFHLTVCVITVFSGVITTAQNTFFSDNTGQSDTFIQPRSPNFFPNNRQQVSRPLAPFSSRPPPPPFNPAPLPTSKPKTQSNCALIVSAPVKQSSFGAPPKQQSICLTYEAVNEAFERARKSVGLLPVGAEGKFEKENVGNLGVIVHETARILARRYGLSRDAVANGLPLVDTTRTSIENYCPNFLMTPTCRVERYRSTTGFCNNLNMPHWGAAKHGHHRYLAPDFADGISAPRISITGDPLPSPRIVSTRVHAGPETHDHAVTMLLVAWGQYIDHDITLSAEVVDEHTGKAPNCCGGSKNEHCLPIEIPNVDNFYNKYNKRCMNFVRTLAGLRHNCRLGPRVSFNEITSFLDAGNTYSNDVDEEIKLRDFRGGRLKMLPFFRGHMKDLLPLRLEKPSEGCIRPFDDVYCFLSGDPRVNEQTILATLHTLFAREHNRITEELQKVNPHWNDETLYQEAKMIVGALQQQITYNEFLPMLLGRQVMEDHDLMLQRDGYFNGYDPDIQPSVATGFVSAAFRVGHTLLPSTIERWSKSHKYIGSQKLSGMLLQPYDLYKEGWMDDYIMGMSNQVAQALDDVMSPEIQNHLFQQPGEHFGLDLGAINIQRAREHGVPSYNRWREWCHLRPARTFDELRNWMKNSTVNHYAQIYSSPEDIDLWSAGISEVPLQGSMVGPTFACIIGKQFKNFRYGDRFWYENGGWPSSFTLEQLSEIRKVKLSRIICDNSDTLESMQVYAMVLHDRQINPRVPCGSGVLGQIDFQKWKDARRDTVRPNNNFVNFG